VHNLSEVWLLIPLVDQKKIIGQKIMHCSGMFPCTISFVLSFRTNYIIGMNTIYGIHAPMELCTVMYAHRHTGCPSEHTSDSWVAYTRGCRRCAGGGDRLPPSTTPRLACLREGSSAVVTGGHGSRSGWGEVERLIVRWPGQSRLHFMTMGCKFLWVFYGPN